MRITIPNLCLVALIGASGSGKSTFATRHFKLTEVLSSDAFRAFVADDENDQSATAAAFDCLYHVAAKRLEAGRMTVVDATNVHKSSRDAIVKLAREHDCHAAAIVLNMPVELCQQRNDARGDRALPSHAVPSHVRNLKHSLRHLKKEGFKFVYVLNSPEEVETAEITRTRLWNDKREVAGPFDIVGDVHGCYDELCLLLETLGYSVNRDDCSAVSPSERKVVFLGDLCDRGPKNMEVLRLVMNMTEKGGALCVPGNHDMKLLRYLRGSKVHQTHGLDMTISQLDSQPEEFRTRVRTFLDSLISHYVLDDGNLVVAHAGLKEKYQGRGSGRVRNFCLFGETTGETDEFGLPVRLDWAEDYRGRSLVVYGHTPVTKVQELNNTICIDTGCVFGGKLTAYRYPEREAVQVDAFRQYYERLKPLDKDDTMQGDMLSIKDVLGFRRISTTLHKDIAVHEDNAAAALETMSRFAADPHWLIYLPPTMSPCETSDLPGYLEHPREAFGYYKHHGVKQIVCEEKHMGSRAVVVLALNAEVAASRFGVRNGSSGLIATRSGRHFFDNVQRDTEMQLLDRLRAVLTKTGFWERFATDWVCLDTELMPWSAKAQALIVNQYASVGRAGRSSLRRVIHALDAAVQTQAANHLTASDQSVDLADMLANFWKRRTSLERYTEAYGRYCWPVHSLDDYRMAPFHILASEGKAWRDETHLTHMNTIKQYMTNIDPLFMATNHRLVDLDSEENVADAVNWWVNLTESGGEGMVVKPLDFVAYGSRGGILQPAIKCRGREYLRIIYGPEYTQTEHMERLKKRSVKKKRRLASAEFALGMEALERFVNGEPLHRVHECVFAVLAMESEPVDPRL